ncbi:MAG: hypothetical protein JNL67_05540 [Planctomycetaceae bacterium]|nr:hypothetical protein [Planctomycetaceae bacterium]
MIQMDPCGGVLQPRRCSLFVLNLLRVVSTKKSLLAFRFGTMSRVLVVAYWLGIGCCFAQDQEAIPTESPSASVLAAWHGRWQGEVTAFSSGTPMRFQMELEIEATDDPKVLEWKVTYDGTAGRSERPYQLHVENEQRGQYVIDEQNGIRLNATLLGESLCFHFATGGQRIWGSYRLDTKLQQITFELMSGSERAAQTTGGGAVPEVQTLSPQSRQIAVLRRMGNGVTPDDPGPTGKSK